MNQDGFVIKEELLEAGCTVKVGLFKAADKTMMVNFLRANLRKASEYIVRRRCPK